MKLTFFLLMIGLLQVSAKGFSQKVTLSADKLTLTEIFERVEKQTGFYFLFKEDDLKTATPVTVAVTDMPLEDFLRLILEKQPLEYSIRQKNVVIFPKATWSYELAVPVTGVVKDATGNVLAGASVRIKGTEKGAITDENGRFTLDAKTGETLIVSFTGYEEKEITLTNEKNLTLVLKIKENELNAVTVSTGYWSTSRKLATGSVVKIESKEIEHQPLTSPLLALQGRVAGLEIMPNSGAPGAAPKIRIRGENSIYSYGKPPGYPLYVIDGVVIDASPLRSMSTSTYFNGIDPLTSIGAENIASIEVLKDADATAIYGSRGANGVILITTKKATQGGRARVDISAALGSGKIPNRLELLNREQYLELRNEAFRNAGMTPSSFDFDLTGWDTTRYTDWQKVLLGGTSSVSQFQGGVTAGNENTSFRIGADYYKETSFASKSMGNERMGANFSGTHHSRDNKLMLAFSTGYGYTKNTLLDLTSYMIAALTLPPIAPALYDEMGKLNWAVVDLGPFSIPTLRNPLAEMQKSIQQKTGTLVANANISYELFKDLRIKANIGITDNNSDENYKEPIAALPPTQITSSSTGKATFGTNRRRAWIVEPQISYMKQFSNHRLEALAGFAMQRSDNQWTGITALGYTSDALLGSLKGASGYDYNADERVDYRYMAWFGRIGYNWKERYVVNLTGRRDGSSRFGPQNKFGNFGAVAAAWIFSDEPFIHRALPFLSLGKLRFSHGTTGSDAIGDYMYYDLYQIGLSKYQNNITLLPAALYNPVFGWELTQKTEAALEISLFNNRVSFQASRYRNVSSKQLIQYKLPFSTGFASVLKNFEASVENKGWEITMQSQNISSRNFSWTTTGNISFPKNKLLAFPGLENSSYALDYKVGLPINSLRRHKWLGIDPQTGKHRLQDTNGDGFIGDDDMQFLDKNLEPKFYGGLLNTFRYRSLELSFLLQFSRKYSQGLLPESPPGDGRNMPVKVLNRWRKPGDITNIEQATVSPDYQYIYANYSNYVIVDGSFIKLKTLSASYTLPAYVRKILHTSDVKIFLQAQNLFSFTSYDGFDPETGARTLPQLRMITGGIQLKF